MPDKRVLIISQVFYPDEVAVANLFTNLCTELVESGFDIEVWSAQPVYTTREKQPKERSYKGVRIHYLRSSRFPKDQPLGRIINFCTFSMSVITRLSFAKDKCQVVSHTTPPFLAIVISFICRWRKRRFLYILMDVFPDGLIHLNKVSRNNILIVIWKKLHLSALKKATRIIVIGRDMKEWLEKIYTGDNKKIEYIPLWQDSDLIHPITFNEIPLVRKLQLDKWFVVQYSGNMGLWNDMIAFGNAVNRCPDGVKFLFIGNGIRKKELIATLNSSNPSNAVFLPFQPNDDYAQTVSACHVGLVSLRNGLEGMAVPSKIIGIMAAGIPVIALVPDQSEIAYIVREAKCGYVINPSDTDGLINAILELKSNETLRKEMGHNGRSAFEKKYSTKIIAEKYSLLLRN